MNLLFIPADIYEVKLLWYQRA